MKTKHELALEILNVLKFNDNLPDDLRVLAIESRLMKFAEEIESAYDVVQKRIKANTVIISDFSNVIPKHLLNNKIILN